MTTPHEHWDELAAGYALDALEPAEEAELLTHLDTCELCRDALRGHELVAAQLAALAEDDDLAPPSWSAIRTGIVGTPSSTSGDVVSIAERRKPTRNPRVLVAVAAAVAIIAGFTINEISTNGQSPRESAISQCRDDSACHVIPLNRGSSEQAVVLVRNNVAKFFPTDMPSLSGNRDYALWQLPRNGKPTLLAQPMLRARVSSVSLVLPYDDTAAFALSLEPGGTQATSPTDVVAIGTAT